MQSFSTKFRAKLKTINRKNGLQPMTNNPTQRLEYSVTKMQNIIQSFSSIFDGFAKNMESISKAQINILQKLDHSNQRFDQMTHPPRRLNEKQVKDFNKNMEMSIQQPEIDQVSIKEKNDLQEIDMEDRFKMIKVDVPELYNKQVNSETRKNEIFTWLGDACKTIFSVSFQRLLNGSLNKKAVKVSCSQNLLYRIIHFIQLNQLEQSQVQAINIFLKQTLLPYFQLKYPQSQTNQINLRLSNKLAKIDNYLDNSNNLVYWSQTDFFYDQQADYSKQIMEVLNYIISVPNKLNKCRKSENSNQIKDGLKKLFHNQMRQNLDQIDGGQVQYKEASLYSLFYRDMENLFKKVQDQDQVIRMKDGLSPSEFQSIRQKLSILPNDSSKKQNYKQKVRQYTKYLIGRKISEFIDQYTPQEVKNRNIVIKNSQILRILNKWCDHLKHKFEETQNIIQNRDQPFRMQDGSQGYLSKTHRILLTKLIQREKVKVDQYLAKVMQNNYKFQANSAKRSLPQNLKWFSEEQSTIGMFTACLYFNNQNYIIGYLNTLIHSLLVATYDFNQVIVLENRTNIGKRTKQKLASLFQKLCDNQININQFIEFIIQKNKNKKNIFMPQSVPQLVTFRLGDLMRCKCSSKQSEITAIYRQIMRVSDSNPQLWKILRIKNRLTDGTRDVLINLTYRNKAVVQIQLQVDQVKSNFIINSSSFKHYLYELGRAQFGPISEMSSIWMNNDHRSQFYKKQYQQINIRKSIDGKKHECLQKITRQEFGQALVFNQKFPFQCSLCKKLWTHSNFIQNHIHCNVCQQQICGRCQIELDKSKIEPNFMAALKGTQNQQKQLRYSHDKIPNFGVSMLLYSKDTIVKKFRQVSYQNKRFIFEILPKQNSFSLMGEVTTDQQKRQFLEKNIVVSFDQPQSKKYHKNDPRLQKQREQNLKIVQNYFLPKQFETLRQEKRTSILQEKKHIRDETFTIIGECPDVLKINFSQNQINSFHLIVQRFPRLQIAVLSSNTFKIIPNSIQALSHSLQYLDLNFNQITQIAQEIVKLQNLNYLNLAHNCIKKLPESLIKLKSLKVLNLGYNNLQSLGSLPLSLKKVDLQKNKFTDEISFQGLKNIINLNLSYNKLKNIKGLQQLDEMKYLDISYNCLENPQFTNMINLQYLNLQSNGLQRISIKYDHPQESELKYLNLSSNRLEFLSEEFFQNICNVQYLSLANTKLHNISKGIYHLKNVEELNISSIRPLNKQRKRKTQVNQDILQLGKQKELIKVKQQQKQILPPQTHDYLVNLGYLYLSSNKLKQIPETIAKMPQLKELDLSSNSIKKINCILAIQFVDLSNNKIREFGTKQAENLATVKYINLKNNNRLRKFDINQVRKVMTNLQQIDINQNMQNRSQKAGSSRQGMTESDTSSVGSQNQNMKITKKKKRHDSQSLNNIQKTQQQKQTKKQEHEILRKQSFQMKTIKQVKKQFQIDKELK